MRKGLLILFLAQTALAAGPKYMGPTPTTYRSSGTARGFWTPIYQEVVNIYHDLQFPQISTATIQNIVTSSANVSLNITGPVQVLTANQSTQLSLGDTTTTSSARIDLGADGAFTQDLSLIRYNSAAVGNLFGVARAGNSFLFTNANGILTLGTGSSNPLIFGVNNVEDGRFTTSGNFQAQGTTTNDNAPAGDIGQWVQATAAGVTGGATGVFTNCASISLTAGDWDVSGVLEFTDNNNPTFTSTLNLALSAFSGNTTTDHVESDNLVESLVPNATITVQGLSIPSWRSSLSTTTTIYAKGQASYSAGGPPKMYCRISARRVR